MLLNGPTSTGPWFSFSRSRPYRSRGILFRFRCRRRRAERRRMPAWQETGFAGPLYFLQRGAYPSVRGMLRYDAASPEFTLCANVHPVLGESGNQLLPGMQAPSPGILGDESPQESDYQEPDKKRGAQRGKRGQFREEEEGPEALAFEREIAQTRPEFVRRNLLLRTLDKRLPPCIAGGLRERHTGTICGIHHVVIRGQLPFLMASHFPDPLDFDRRWADERK